MKQTRTYAVEDLATFCFCRGPEFEVTPLCICSFLRLLKGILGVIDFVCFLARDAFVRTNRCAIAMVFACLSVCLSRTSVHCDYTVHYSADLTLWLDSPIFWAPLHQSMSTYSQPSFSSFTWKRGWLWTCKLSEDLNASSDK